MADPEQFRKVFIGGLSYKTTEEGLRAFYSQWGELLDAVVMTDKTTGYSRGFGFVTYSESAMVDDAMANRPHTIDGRTVQPKRAVPREESGTPGANITVNKIFIGGIRDKPITKEDLDLYFGTFGAITDCVIMVEKETNKPRGFAFVEFDDYDAVDQIILRKYHEINGVKIDVKKALPRDGVSGEPPKGGNRGGAAARRGGGVGGRGAGRDGGGGRGGAPSGRGGGARSLMGSDGYGGGRGRGGYANEDDYANENGWNQSQVAGWNPDATNNDNHQNNNDAGCNQSYCVSYPGYGPPQRQQQHLTPLQQQQPPAYQQQQQQQQQQNYNAGYGSDFGQNYAQYQGGGPLKGSSAGGGGGLYGGRKNPYASNSYGR